MAPESTAEERLRQMLRTERSRRKAEEVLSLRLEAQLAALRASLSALADDLADDRPERLPLSLRKLADALRALSKENT